jgi:hypothetical protein
MRITSTNIMEVFIKQKILYVKLKLLTCKHARFTMFYLGALWSYKRVSVHFLKNNSIKKLPKYSGSFFNNNEVIMLALRLHQHHLAFVGNADFAAEVQVTGVSSAGHPGTLQFQAADVLHGTVG